MDYERRLHHWDNKVQIMPITITETTSVEVLLGDVNDDHEVNITDVTMLINAVMSENFSTINTANADMNGDGNINITDVTMLINAVMAM